MHTGVVHAITAMGSMWLHPRIATLLFRTINLHAYNFWSWSCAMLSNEFIFLEIFENGLYASS